MTGPLLGAVPVAGSPGSVDAPLALALADEMVALTSGLADLAYDLGSEPETLRRHMASLQAIDEITQRQIALADVLRSDAAIADRFAALTLDALGASLSARYRTYAGEGGDSPQEADRP
jgi:hypothetical protein